MSCYIPTDDLSLYELTERYPDEASAIRYFEEQRWPGGSYCPKCGAVDTYVCSRSRRLPLHKCRDCRRQFTVTTGTVMEHTMLPLRKWLFAFHLIGGSKKGIPSRYLARALKLTPKSAWHLAHRVRATMVDNDGPKYTGTVEMDEVQSDGQRTTAAIKRMEGKRVTLYKGKGGGDSLFDRGRPKDKLKREKKGGGK